MKIRTGILTLSILVFSAIMDLSAAIDQTYVERILKENREFVDYIDICVTNFAQDKKDLLFTIYQNHFNAEVLFLQGEYKKAFDNVYKSQEDMVKLYEYILFELYLEDSKKMLGSFAPVIIRSKNNIARQYLTLGYRDRTVSNSFYKIGEASHPKLYSYKIFKYKEGITYARRAKRYALLSLYTSQNIETKRKIFNQMFKEENKARPFFSRFVDKNDDDYIKEMNKTWEEYVKEQKSATGNTGSGDDGTGNQGNRTDAGSTYTEGRIEKEVRFRKEQMVSKYLMNGEFDKAELIIRSYVENYNYKLIMATLEYLNSAPGQDTTGSAKKLDYAAMIIHHKDNYHIIKQEKSVLEELVGKVKVVDDVQDDNQPIENPGTN